MKEKNILHKLRSQERDIRKTLILDAAERVFSNKPHDKVSMQEIAREAGLTKSSIYTYFPNQESLFVETYLRDFRVLMEDLYKIIDLKETIKLGDIISTFIDHFDKHDSFFRMASLFMLHGNLSEESLKKLDPAGREMINVFDQVFESMNYKGNVRMLSHTLLSALSGILLSYKKYPGRNNDEVLRHMKRLGELVKEMLIAFIEKFND